MPSELDLLRSLDDEPRTPSTVDIRRAIADGRRRRRNRRRVGYAGTAAVTAAVVAGAWAGSGLITHARPRAGAARTPTASGAPTGKATAAPKAAYRIPGTPGWSVPAATAPTSCTLSRLPAPENAPMALVSGADPTGRYIVGRSYPKPGGYQAVIWHDGNGKNVMLPGDLEEDLADVNSSGTAVGWSYAGGDTDSGPVPYVYRDGKVSRLPGVSRGSAYAINEAGAIAGDDGGGGPVVWPSATAQPIRLPVPAGTDRAAASDIDEDGTVVGTLNPDQMLVPSAKGVGTTIPYVWFPDGTHRQLPIPSLNGEKPLGASARSIRNGWVTGMAMTAGQKGWAVRWNLRTGEVRAVEQLPSGVDAVNAQGWLIGTDHKGRAALFAGAAPVVLPPLASNQTDGLSVIASTISDDGRTIGGQADNSNDVIQAVIWHCR